MKESYDIVVIGGGAAGYFAAIHAADGGANEVVILEKTSKVLTKVAVSGGGRCNLTHDCEYPAQLLANYPRGGKALRKSFELFDAVATKQWFEERGVKLKTEPDGRVFPTTDSSQTIIDCLNIAADDAGVRTHLKREVVKLEKRDRGGFILTLAHGEIIETQKVIITTGGSNKADSYKWLQSLGLEIAMPVPSLFTFNVPQSNFKDLMGLSVPNGKILVPGTKWKSDGPVLITHWGFSAPAVIKLSAWAAIYLHSLSYNFPIMINWTGKTEEETRTQILEMRKRHPAKLVVSNQLFDLPSRLWERICESVKVNPETRFADLPAKQNNKLVENLIRSPFAVSGKTTFKEEFVTCGGVELDCVQITSFESKLNRGLYLAGEVLNVDGITGGFNFQHAWTSGYLAGKNAAKAVNLKSV